MPELPEVEIARRQLHRRFTGQVVTADVLDAGAVRSKLSTKPSDADPDGAEKLRRALGTAEEPVRHGKRIAWPFADHAVLVHLGMTGQFTRADRVPCPACGRPSAWFWLSPGALSTAQCHHKDSCGWWGHLDELLDDQGSPHAG